MSIEYTNILNLHNIERNYCKCCGNDITYFMLIKDYMGMNVNAILGLIKQLKRYENMIILD